jgi:metal-sulfur cluster biosynthetic enzyme
MNDFSGQSGTNRPSWQIESTHPELYEPAKKAFEEVIDPELGLNIWQLGLIRDVIVTEENTAIVKMILTTPFCPYGPSMIESTRQKAEEGLKMEVHIDLGMEMWDFSMMEEGLGGDWGLY